jgi:arylformamidase
MSGTEWLDVTVPIQEQITVFPDTPGVSVNRVSEISQGDDATVSELRLSTHTGTHIDAPSHFLEDGDPVDRLDLASLNGPARVLDLADSRRVGRQELAGHELKSGERILLRTSNSTGSGGPWYGRDFDPDYAHLACDGARELADRGVAAVGIDYLSIGGEGRDNPETHRTLLDAGITILEGLALEDVEPGRYELNCLPMLVKDGDGAPARALLRPLPWT